MTSRTFQLETKDLTNQIHDALAPLLVAIRYANQLGRDPWEFAVEIDQLSTLGLTPNDFRWLVRSGLVTHRREVTLEGDNGRQFQSAGDLTYGPRSCFVLTEIGIQLARQLHQKTGLLSDVDFSLVDRPLYKNGRTGNKDASVACIPTWDSERRELRFDGVIVKHFKWVAVNQQTILGAFEEDGWPARIDDPLPPNEEQDSKRRLADTIKCLNRKQCHAVLHFRGDGTGEGVIWEQVEMPAPSQ